MVGKPELEFHVPQARWHRPDGSADGVWEQELARDKADGSATVLQRYDPGVDATHLGVLSHTFWEEVYLISGHLTDTALGQTFGPGTYACRPPGMRHGPYTSSAGCLMLVTIRTV